MKTVQIIANSCENREIELNSLIEHLKKNNFRVISNNEPLIDADYIIVSTCAVTKTQEGWAADLIKKALKNKGGDPSRVIVCGCLPGINKDLLSEVFSGKSFGPRFYGKLNATLGISDSPINVGFSSPLIFFPGRKTRYIELKRRFFYHILRNRHLRPIVYLLNNIEEHAKLLRFSPYKTFAIQIQVGCPFHCSYCAIPNSVGNMQSQRIEEIIKVIEHGLGQGFRQFLLTGECISAYGTDINQNLKTLLREILLIRKQFKIQLNNINPDSFLNAFDEIYDLVRKGKVETIFVPTQSANKRVLGMMHRSYDKERLIAAIKSIRRLSRCVIGTTILVGFPSESRDDLEDTVKFCEEARFDFIKAFGYSDRPGTKALGLSGKITQEEIIYRCNLLVRRLWTKSVVEIVSTN